MFSDNVCLLVQRASHHRFCASDINELFGFTKEQKPCYVRYITSRL